MPQLKRLVAFVLALAALQLGATRAAAQDEAEQVKLCSPPVVADYPYSIDRIRRAMNAAGYAPEHKQGVARVAVFDSEIHEGNFAINLEKIDDVFESAHTDPLSGKLGHGTFVAGLVKGGFYAFNKHEMPSKYDRALPSVRTLFTSQQPDAPPSRWTYRIQLIFFEVRGENSRFEIDKARMWPLLAIGKPLERPHIVNLSFEVEYDAEKQDERATGLSSMLIVAAAGNDRVNIGKQLRYPASLEDFGNRLVVAAHDRHMKLWDGVDQGSNYGAKFVNIAAPGECIQSWDSEEPDKMARDSGTSAAAPIVSFAAALIKMNWPDAQGSELHDRILLSSSFSQNMFDCEGADANLDGRMPCVRYGSVLDIPAAMLFPKDFIEYCAIPIKLQCPPDDRRLAVGKLQKFPTQLCSDSNRPGGGCGSEILPADSAFRRGSSIRGRNPGRPIFQYLYPRSGRGLDIDEIEIPNSGVADDIIFGVEETLAGPKESRCEMDGLAPNSICVQPGRLIRIVTQAKGFDPSEE